MTSWGTYGEEAGRELVKQARQGGVCVAQTITLPEGDLTRESANRVVQVGSVEMGQGGSSGTQASRRLVKQVSLGKMFVVQT